MFKKISIFSKRKVRQVFKKRLNKKDIAFLKNSNFVLISNNCWGGAAYQWFERPYNSPFIGLFLYGPCYIKLLQNFDEYMHQKLIFVSESRYPDRKLTYPLATLNDIEIHFTHYATEEEAKNKWERRTLRMLEEKNRDHYFFKICDRERVSNKILEEFHQLPFKNKISFSVKNLSTLKNKNHFKIHNTDRKNKNHVPNGKKLFKLTFYYFDLPKWLCS